MMFAPTTVATPWQLQAAAQKKKRQRDTTAVTRPLEDYAYDPAAYIEDKLKWQPWSGTADKPGQMQVIEAYTLALRQLHERDEWEKGELQDADLEYWQPGGTIKNWIHVPAGHTVGKTKLASGLVNHFFDAFTPSIIYTFAPTWEQIHDLLWKEIKSDRRGKGLPGRVLDLALEVAANHFAKGRATNNVNDTGSERIQGQHGRYLMFVLDEAEGIPKFVWDAVDSMTSGGIAIVLMLANPRTRASRFHKEREKPYTSSLTLSCLWHPNVIHGREIVPGGVRRQWVDKMVNNYTEAVEAHSEDDFTFALPWRDGIFKPQPEFMFRVMGIAPKSVSERTFVPFGRYEAATKRPLDTAVSEFASMGVDAARFGTDVGTLWVRNGRNVWLGDRFPQQRKGVYVASIRREARALAQRGVRRLHVRVDGTGGFGTGVVDDLVIDDELHRLFTDFQVFEIHFGGAASGKAIDGGDGQADGYADIVTEMYAHAGETMMGLSITNPPEELENDLCDRQYGVVNRHGKTLYKLEDKEDFRKRHRRSPDDGDGVVMAVAPEFLFASKEDKPAVGAAHVTMVADVFG